MVIYLLNGILLFRITDFYPYTHILYSFSVFPVEFPILTPRHRNLNHVQFVLCSEYKWLILQHMVINNLISLLLPSKSLIFLNPPSTYNTNSGSICPLASMNICLLFCLCNIHISIPLSREGYKKLKNNIFLIENYQRGISTLNP